MSPETVRVVAASLGEQVVRSLAPRYGFDEEEARKYLSNLIDINIIERSHTKMADMTKEDINNNLDTPNAESMVGSNVSPIQMSNELIDAEDTNGPADQEQYDEWVTHGASRTIEQIQEENRTLKNKISKLEHDIEMSRNKGKILFRDLIKEKTGYSVIKATQEQLDECRIIAENAIEIMKNEYNLVFPKNRINECGNFMEIIVDKADPRIIKPTNLQGCKKGTVYPDREKKNDAYVEIKILAEGSENSTLRSFYVSTFDKVTKSMPHILMAFTREKKPTNDPPFCLTNDAPKIIDLYDLALDIKVEYNASNNIIYRM